MDLLTLDAWVGLHSILKQYGLRDRHATLQMIQLTEFIAAQIGVYKRFLPSQSQS